MSIQRALALVVLAAACAPAPPAGPAEASSFPMRIVPASATAVDLVVALVEPARVAGFPEQALEYSTLHGDPPAFAGHPRFDSWLAEPVLALRPDLVVVDPWQAPDTNARLAEAGVAVHRVREVHGLEDACQALSELAAVLGAGEQAEVLLGELEARRERLEQRADARGERPRALCYSNFGAAGWSAGGETTIDAVMRLAGCTNLVAEAGERGHVELDFERLLLFDPDLILVSRPLKMGEGPAGDRGGASQAVLESEPALAGLRAVRERRIVSLPAWLYASGSHELMTAAEYLADELDRLAEDP